MIPAIVNHLWHSTVVALAAALVAFALRRHQARVRHAVWLAASLKFLLPFSLLIAIGGALSRRAAPADVGASAPAFVETVQTITEPFSDNTLAATSAPVVHPTIVPWPLVFATLWAVGVVVVLAMRLRRWQKVRAALLASTPATLAGVGGDVRVRASSGLLEPGVVGVWRPVLLVPDGLEALLTDDQLRAVIAHELHHIRRRDNLTSLMHMGVEAVFWFHPMVWWIGARLVDERERACDEHVVASGAEPDAYAEAILNVCKRYVEVPVACVAGVTGSDLKKRVNAILAGRVSRDLSVSRKTLVVLAATVALGAPVAAGVITAPVRTLRLAQAPGSVPKFEVVSVRPCDAAPTPPPPGAGRSGPAGSGSPGRLYYPCSNLLNLIRLAYSLYANGHVNSSLERPLLPWSLPFTTRNGYPMPPGLPDWTSKDKFTIEAKAEGEPPLPVLLGPMLQGLLEDRFKLKVHRETRTVPVYELVVAKGGSKLTPVTPGTCVQYDYSVSPQPTPSPGQHRCTNHNERDANGDFVDMMEMITVDQFFGAWTLDRPVVDKTGITGPVAFTFVVHGQQSNPDDAMAARIAAMRSELGLELRPGNAPLDFLVIDHVEKPTSAEAVASATAGQAPAPTVDVSSSAGQASATQAPQKFDVASIRPCESTPSTPGGRNGGVGPVFSPGLFVYNCGTLEQLINGAYINYGDSLLNDEGRLGGRQQVRDDKIFPQRIRGGPDWTRTDRFMIEAKTAVSSGRSGREAVPERAVMMGPMLRALLEDRFQLKLHRDVQDDVPMYALTVAKTGLKIKPAGPDSCTQPDPNRAEPYKMNEEIAAVRQGGKPICGHGIMGGPIGSNNALVLNGQTMEGVAHFLSGIMDRHVLDKTGIADKFVIYLEYAPDDQVPYDFLVLPRPTDPPTAPSITQALKALGLELTPTKGQKGYIVIDHVERPRIDGLGSRGGR